MYPRRWIVGALSFLVITILGVHSQIEQFVEPDPDAGLSGDAKHDAEVRLKRLLVKNYAVDAIPPQNVSGPIRVKVGLSIIAIQDLDAQKQLLTVESWLKLTWSDPRLSWSSEKFENIGVIRIDDTLLWKPDIMLYNGAQGYQKIPVSQVLALVYENGEVVIVPPVTFKAYCPVDLKFYPYDEHDCFLKFGSWTHDGYLMDFVFFDNKSNPDLSDTFDNAGEWDITGGSALRTEKYYDCCKEPYPDVSFTISLRRRSPFYKVAILCPVIAAVLLIMTSLWMSPVTRDRITINFVALIVLVGTMLFLVSQIPAVGHSVPVIVAACGYLIIVTIIMTMSTILFASIARSRRREALPNQINSITGSRLATILFVPQPKSFEVLSNPADAEEAQSDDGKHSRGGATSDYFYHWISLFQLIDRIAFFIFTLVIIIWLITASS